MRVDWAILAEAASAHDNLAFIIGAGLDTFKVPEELEPSIPPLPHCLAIRLLLSKGELQRPHHLDIVFSDADGTEVGKASADFFVPATPDLPKGWEQAANIVLNGMLQPTKFGEYSVDIFGDNNQHLKSIAFRVIKVSSTKHP